MAQGKPLLIVTLIVLTLSASACTRRSPLDTKAIRNWAETEGYVWNEGPDEIRTEQAFFDYIDGAAQPIIDLGWKRSVFGVLTKGESRLRLAVHQMRDPKAAVALFRQNVFKDTQSVAIGEQAVYWDRGLFSKGITFQKKGLVCELILEKAENKDKVTSLASSFEALID